MKKLHILLLIFFAALLALGQLQRFSITPVTAMYLHDLVLIGWIAILIATNFKKTLGLLWQATISFFSNWVLVTLSLIGLIGWTAAVATDSFPVWTLLFTARLTSYMLWAWLLVKLKPISTHWLQLCFISTGLLLMLFGILQYIFLPDLRFLSISGWDDHYYRLLSTQLDPNFTGLILTTTLFWLWSLPFSFWEWLIHGLSTDQLRRVQKLSTISLSSLLLISISLTFSRSTLVSLLAGLLVYGYTFVTKSDQPKKTKFKLHVAALSIMAVVITTLFIAPKPSGEGVNLLRTSTLYSRIDTASNWLNSLQPYQIAIGRGLFVPPKNELQTDGAVEDHANLPDSIVVLFISGLGVIGTALAGILALTSFQKLKLENATIAIVASILTHSLFNNSLLQSFVLLFLLAKIVENSMSNQLVEKVKEVVAT